MRSSRLPVLLAALTLGLLLLFRAGQPVEYGWLPDAESGRDYARRALRTQRFTAEYLTHLHGGRSCGSSSFLGLAREVGSELSDAWYDASQLLADSAMLKLGQTDRLCAMVKTVAFLDLLERPGPVSGYYPRANVDGTSVTTRDTYADDNALIGLAFLEARAAGVDPAWREALLRRAELSATFLLESGLWDSQFGGGFWWNTNRGYAPEGKPTQTTALAGLLFARLYEETGQQQYAQWARSALSWLDSRLLDPATGLYRYGVRHWSAATLLEEYVDPRLFGYDQGILLELHLLFERAIEPNAGHLQRAQQLAEQLDAVFWDPERGSYRLDAQQPETYTPYAAWLSQSLLALHAVDHNPLWLERARANLDAIELHLLDPADGGYFHMQFRCPPAPTDDCPTPDGWGIDRTKLLFAQAWMQRSQALLAARLASEAPEAGHLNGNLPPNPSASGAASFRAGYLDRRGRSDGSVRLTAPAQ